MAGTFTALHYHVVFSTKDRVPMIHADLQPRLYDFIGGTIRQADGVLLAIGGMLDHLHLLIRMPPSVCLSDFMRAVKSKSSGWIHEHFPDLSKFAWQPGYGAFAVSKSDLGRVEDYIGSQAEHHRKITFKDEFRKFLEAHEIEFDERYLW
jgi:REP element-mobilizing transposase RayT